MTSERGTRTGNAPPRAAGSTSPVDPDLPETGAGNRRTVEEAPAGDGGPTPEELQLLDWWAGLPSGWQRQLAVLREGGPLPRTVAEALHRRGITLQLVLRAEHGRLVRRTMPSSTLLSFIAARQPPAPTRPSTAT